MQQKISSHAYSSAPNNSSRRRSSDLPGIREVLGHELCTGGPRRRSSSREFFLGTYPKFPLSTSPGKLNGSQPYAIASHSMPFNSAEQHVPRGRKLSYSPSSNGVSLPAILQKLHMEDDATREKNPNAMSAWDARLYKRHSWNYPMDASRFSLHAYNHCLNSDEYGTSKLYPPRRKSSRMESSLMEFYCDTQAPAMGRAIPINIPDSAGTRSSDESCTHALSHSYSPYSASCTSDNFPNTPRQEVSELQPADFRMIYPETVTHQSPRQASKAISTTPDSVDLMPGTVSAAKRQDAGDVSPSQTEPTNSRSKGSGSNGKFECSYCNKKFSRPSSLRTHIHSHTGEKPFRCDAPGCGRCFSVHSNLRRHQKSHSVSSISPIKPQPT